MKRYCSPPAALLQRQVVSYRVSPARWMPTDLLLPGLTTRLYWLVRVFEDVEATRAFQAWRCREADHSLEGVVIPMPVVHYPKGQRRKNPPAPYLMPRQGEVLLHRGWIGSEIIAHEAVHLASSTLRALGDLHGHLPPSKLLALTDEIGEVEERLAYLAGIFARLVTDGLYEHGLVPARRAGR